MNKSSFTTASTFPVKVLSNADIVNSVTRHNIRPYHIQINPTNICNLQCSYCSCKNRNNSSIGFSKICDIIDRFEALGTRAVTITGGGEPLAYKQINDLVKYIKLHGMDVGLTTNGLLLGKATKKMMNMVTWCRISVSDEQPLRGDIIDSVLNEDTDFAFSYVLSDSNTNYENLIACVEYANKNKFTHVRIVDDILGDFSVIENVKNELKSRNVDDSLVIYQGRKIFNRGNKRCLISLLKPNIDADGNMLPCCGVQYAKKDITYDFDKSMIMNRGLTINEVYQKQQFFDGSQCDVCYYSEYNDLLNMLWDSGNLQHKNFV